MHRALAEAIVELDPVRRGAGEEGGVEEVGAPGAARDRNAARRAHRREHRLGAARHLAAGARNHHADGVEQVALGIVAHFVGKRGVAQLAHEFDHGCGRAGGIARLQNFGVGHGGSLRARASNRAPRPLIPAQAGIQSRLLWVPACAGTSGGEC